MDIQYICPNGYTPDYLNNNGTIYVICVENTLSKGLIIGSVGLLLLLLLLGLGLFFCISCCYRNNQENVKYGILFHPNKRHLRRWEEFINDGGYIRRIAQLLEMEETISKELDDYFAENYPDLWKKINQDDYNFISRSANLIKVLFDEQAKMEKKSVFETICFWEEKIVDKCGGEFGLQIMEQVKQLCLENII